MYNAAFSHIQYSNSNSDSNTNQLLVLQSRDRKCSDYNNNRIDPCCEETDPYGQSMLYGHCMQYTILRCSLLYTDPSPPPPQQPPPRSGILQVLLGWCGGKENLTVDWSFPIIILFCSTTIINFWHGRGGGGNLVHDLGFS